MKLCQLLSLMVGIMICGFNHVQAESSRSHIFDQANETKEVLIVSSLDGTLHGIDVMDGKTLWAINNPPLVSQSLSDLEFAKDGVKYRLIPSLEGQLYVLETDSGRKGLHALPITADALFTSSFQLSPDSQLVGGKEQRVMGINPFTGEEKYRCSKEGCKQSPEFHAERRACELLVVRRVSHVVRAVGLESGEERWNFSVGQEEVLGSGGPQAGGPRDVSSGAVEGGGCVLLGEQDGAAASPGNTRWSFDVEAGTIQASSRSPFSVVRWRRQLSASLSRVWVLRGDIVRPLAVFSRDEHNRLLHLLPDIDGCPSRRSLFLGNFQGQMYVQLEDGGGSRAPRPLYVALRTPPPQAEAEAAGRGLPGPSEVQTRYRVSKVTQAGAHAARAPGGPHGFFRPVAQDLPGAAHKWFSLHEDCYPYSDPLVVRFGSFLFQKLALVCLLGVVGHLAFMRLYLPLQARRAAVEAATVAVRVEDSAVPSPPPPSPPPSQPQHTSRYESDYEHIRCLGKGAFGVVFEARHRVDQYRYAVKRVRVRNSVRARGRLLQEVQAFAHLEHPGVVRYYQAWFELPPRGWQEERDRALRLVNGCGDSEGDGTETETGSDEGSTSESGSGSQDAAWSSAGIEDRDASRHDSLIIFDRSQAATHSLSSSGVFARSSSLSGAGARGYGSCSASAAAPDTGPSNSEEQAPAPNNGGGDCTHIYLFISMHLYSGTTLQHRLAQHPSRPSRDSLLHIFAQIVEAVAYLHQNGLMHRDLKPSNILFDELGHIRIADFGLATPLHRTKAAAAVATTLSPQGGPHPHLGPGLHTSNVGTELYMSPEQQLGSQYDQKVDIFALGIILLELTVPLTTGMERALVLTKARSLDFSRDLRARYPEEVALASQLLRHDPALRPSCDEILAHRLLAGLGGDDRVRARSRSRHLSVDL